MMKKKFLQLFLAGALALSVTACGSDKDTVSTTGDAQAEEGASDEETADASDSEDAASKEQEEAPAAEVEDPMAAALENMNSVTSMETQMVMYMDFFAEVEGENQNVKSVTTMDMACFTDPMKIKMDMTMDMGENGQVSMSIYGDTDDDGNYMMYMYDGESWQAAPAGVDDMAMYDAQGSMASQIGDGSAYTLEGTEKLNGADAYKYSNVMAGDEMKEALMSSGALDSLSSLGMSANDVAGMLDGLGEMVTYVWVDAETLYPVQYEMDMTDVMDALMSAVVESMGEEAEGLKMGVTKMELTMTCSNFNSVADFTVPDEAKEAASADAE